MMKLRPSLFAPILFAFTLDVGDAHADTPSDAPGSTEMREAETRFKEGLQLYSQGSINEARVKLVQAYAVLGRTNILWNLAVAEFYSSRFLESVRHVRTFVKAPDADPSDVELATKQFLPQLEKQTGRINVNAPRGSTLAVDGDELGPAPLDEPVDVLPGRHLVLARTASGNATLSVNVRAGQIVPAKLTDAGEAAATERAAGAGAAPGSDRAPGHDAETAPSSTRTVTVIVLGSGALVAAGVGAAFLLSSSSSSDQAKSLADKLGGDRSACTGVPNPDCAQLREANEARDRDAGLATGLFVGAGVLAVSAGLAYLLWPSGAAKSAPRAAIAPTPGGASAKLTIHF